MLDLNCSPTVLLLRFIIYVKNDCGASVSHSFEGHGHDTHGHNTASSPGHGEQRHKQEHKGISISQSWKYAIDEQIFYYCLGLLFISIIVDVVFQ